MRFALWIAIGLCGTVLAYGLLQHAGASLPALTHFENPQAGFPQRRAWMRYDATPEWLKEAAYSIQNRPERAFDPILPLRSGEWPREG